MRPELRTEMIDLLEEAQSKPEGIVRGFGPNQGQTFEALDLLEERGDLQRKATGHWTITIQGYDYYKELKAPRTAWLKANLLRILLAIGGALIAAALGLLTKLWLD